MVFTGGLKGFPQWTQNDYDHYGQGAGMGKGLRNGEGLIMRG
jgi:hypothetical protein